MFTLFVAFGAIGILLAINNQATNQPANTMPTTTPVASSSAAPLISEAISPTDTQEKVASKEAVIRTSKGNITVMLYPNEAPKTVENFVKKAERGFYNNLLFHRVEDWVIQGGDPDGNGTGGGNMQTELNNKPFLVGSLGVARGNDIKISNDAQFFITKKEASWLNNQYTNFGIVKKGMEVVDKIQIGDKILKIIVE